MAIHRAGIDPHRLDEVRRRRFTLVDADPVGGASKMEEAVTGLLDGTLMVYTYPEMGTVSVAYRNGSVSFEWVAGPLKGQAGEDFAYRARKVGDDQFFVNWHEPDAHGFVTLHIDFQANHVHSSVLAAYATNDEQIFFHRASIDRVKRSGES